MLSNMNMKKKINFCIFLFAFVKYTYSIYNKKNMSKIMFFCFFHCYAYMFYSCCIFYYQILFVNLCLFCLLFQRERIKMLRVLGIFFYFNLNFNSLKNKRVGYYIYHQNIEKNPDFFFKRFSD